jgi:hypothetical protein
MKLMVNIKIARIGLLLNTAGNLSSEQIIEKTVLAPATFLMSLLSLRLAISKKT